MRDNFPDHAYGTRYDVRIRNDKKLEAERKIAPPKESTCSESSKRSAMDQAWRYPFWPPYPGYFQPPVYGAGNNDQQSGPSHEEQNCDGSLLPRDQTYELDEEDFEEVRTHSSCIVHKYFFLPTAVPLPSKNYQYREEE